MAENTKIEWATHTFNPWVGCQKVSPACDHCYAEAWAKRGKLVTWGPGAERRLTSEANWRLPIKWQKEAERTGTRPRVFCASLADVFDNAVPPQWRADLLQLIKDTPNLDWLLLTKRIGNANQMLQDAADLMDSGMGVFAPSIYPHVWLGATICNQEEADRDITRLLEIPVAKHFLSVEPMLGPIDVSKWVFDREGAISRAMNSPGAYNREQADSVIPRVLDWVICGGESGPHSRPMNPAWARDLRDQCNAAGVPFFFKQWGEWSPTGRNSFATQTRMLRTGKSTIRCYAFSDGEHLIFEGKKLAGRLLDGRTWDEVPQAPIEINIKVGEKP